MPSSLFSPKELKKSRALVLDDREPRCIPTGPSRLVESAATRKARLRAEAWTSLVAAVRRSAKARLMLMAGWEGSDLIGCPWRLAKLCDGDCRCCGTGLVTVMLLREHYATLANEIERLR